MVLFINPLSGDFAAVHTILKSFGDASGLRTNIEKAVAYTISCTGIDIGPMLNEFGPFEAGQALAAKIVSSRLLRGST